MCEHVARELKRMLVRQAELPVESVEYAQLLRNIEILAGTADMYEDIVSYIGLVDEGITQLRIIPGGLREQAEEIEAESTTEETEQVNAEAAQISSEPEMKVMTAEELKEKDVQWSPADVRKALVEARKHGVNVSELLHEFGVENFSSFPAGRYVELMTRLEEVGGDAARFWL